MPATQPDADTQTYTDKYGVTMVLGAGHNISELLKTQRFYDDEGVLLLGDRVLRPGMTVMDVGANLGQFTLFAAARVGKRGVVHTFEPASETYAGLTRNIELGRGKLARIVPNRAAVTDTPGKIELHEFAGEYSVWNSMHAHTMKVLVDGTLRTVQPSRVEQVPAVTLDDYCHRHGIESIDLLKVDVEGWEVSVLLGARRIFAERRCKNLIFEISIEPLKGTPYTAADVLRCAAEMGFAISRIMDDGSAAPVDLSSFVAPPFANYFGRAA